VAPEKQKTETEMRNDPNFFLAEESDVTTSILTRTPIIVKEMPKKNPKTETDEVEIEKSKTPTRRRIIPAIIRMLSRFSSREA